MLFTLRKGLWFKTPISTTAFLISRCDFQNPFSAVWAILRTGRQHRITVGTTQMPFFVLVKKRFKRELLAAAGAVRGRRFDSLTALRTDFGLFHHIGAKAKLLHVFETQFLCHINPASSRRSAGGRRRDKKRQGI